MMTSYFSRGVFEIHSGHVAEGEAWVVVGSVAELGSWDACRGLKLERHGDIWRADAYIYNVWNTDVEWKAVRRHTVPCDDHPVRKCDRHSKSWWQPGANNKVHVGGDSFHSAVNIEHAIENERRESEHRARLENEAKNSHVTFEVVNGVSRLGEAYYIVGSAPELGEWDVARAVKMHCVEYPTWRADVYIHNQRGAALHWKFVRMNDAREPTSAVWQAGFDNIVALDDATKTTKCDVHDVHETELSYLRHRVCELEALLANAGHLDVNPAVLTAEETVTDAGVEGETAVVAKEAVTVPVDAEAVAQPEVEESAAVAPEAVSAATEISKSNNDASSEAVAPTENAISTPPVREEIPSTPVKQAAQPGGLVAAAPTENPISTPPVREDVPSTPVKQAAQPGGFLAAAPTENPIPSPPVREDVPSTPVKQAAQPGGLVAAAPTHNEKTPTKGADESPNKGSSKVKHTNSILKRAKKRLSGAVRQ